jgi:gliding motility-associated-like protein
MMKVSTSNLSAWLILVVMTLGLSLASTSTNAQGPTCLTADPFCTGTPITFPASTNTGTAELGPDYGCLLTQPNPAWYYMEIATGGVLEITISNSNNEDIDFILYGPFVDQTSPCTALLTAGNTVDCSYSTTATEVATINPANAGEFYLMMITNFSNNPTDISFQETGPTTATTNCAIVCPPVAFGFFNSGTGTIDPLAATYDCNDPAFAIYADQDGFSPSEAITPCYVVQVFPTNGIGTNSMEYFEDGASLGGFGTIGTDSNGNPWVTNIGAGTNFSGYVSYLSPSANSPGQQVQLCNNTGGANMTYNVLDCHTGTVLASGTWNGAVGCQTITVAPPPTLAGLATWSTTCGAGALPVVTDWGAAVFDPSAIAPGTTCDITYNWDAQNGNCVGSETQTVTITNPYSFTSISYATPFCQAAGGTANVTLTGTTGGAYTSSPPGLSINGGSGQINIAASTPGTYTVSYLVGTALPSACNAGGSTSITILPDVNPAWTNPSPICATAGSINLDALITGTTGGSWSGTGVTGSSFNPASGTQNVTYTVGTAPCQESSVLSITVEPDVDPSWTDPSPICASAGSINLNALITGTTGGSWSGTGVTGSNFNPASGTQTVTYSVGNAPCAEQLAISITVEPDVDPSWTNPSPICATAGSINLDALITGTTGGSWSGTGVTGSSFNPASGTQTVTYSVGNAPCAEVSAQVITVEPDVDPSWTDPSPICANAGSINLDALITGTTGGSWSGTGVTGSNFNPASGTQTVTYSVGNAPCAEQLAISITVEPDVDPSWTNPSICANAGSINLDLLITGTTGGSWSGTGVTGNSFNPASGTQTVTYTVGNAPCVEQSAQSITVEPDVDPSWTDPSPICANAGSINLDALITGTTGGSWSGTGVTGSNFNPASGTQNVTYTVGNSPCDETMMISITVEPDVDPSWTNPTICATGGSINLDLLITGTTGGTWSGTGVTGNSFDPASGTQTVTYDVGNAPCAEQLALSITVEPDVDPSWTDPSPICAAAGSINLDALITGTTGGSWSGTGVTGSSFNPASGTQNVTYTVGNSPCDETMMISITVEPDVDPTWTDPSPICEGSGLLNLDALITGTTGGTWSGTGVTGTDFDPSGGTQTVTYSVGNAPCAEQLAISITVDPDDDPSFNYASSTFCITGTDPSPTITGFTPGSFSGTGGIIVDPVTGVIDLAGSGTGSYTVTYLTQGPCPQQSVINVTITTAPDATFNYPPGPHCIGGGIVVPTFPVGSSAGSFSATPAGLAVNIATGDVDLGASAPGTYTVTNDIVAQGGCAAASASTTITIDTLDDASFTYPSATYCTSDPDPSPTVTGLPTGGFTGVGGVIVDPVTGVIDIAGSGTGTFDITYLTTGTCPNSSTFQVTISAQQSAVITPVGPFCDGATSVTLVGADTGGLWTGTGITDTNLGTFDPATAGVGSHVVTYTISGACGDQQTETIVIDPLDDPTFNYPQTAFCLTDPDPTPTVTGTMGGDFFGTGGVVVDQVTGVVDIAASGQGTFDIEYVTNGPCPDSLTIQIVISSQLSAVITPAGPFCAGDPASNMVGADIGGTWSGTGITDPVNGTFDPATAGPGSHTITYDIPGSCGDTQTEVIVVDPQADATITAVGPFCDSDPSVNLVGVTGGGTWSGTGITDPVNGTFDPATAGAGTHTVTYTVANPCGDTQTLDIVVDPMPVAPVAMDSTICSGDPIPALTATGGTGTFNWYDDPAGTNLVGTGASFTPPVSGVGTYVYYVSETVGGCTGPLTMVTLTIGGPTASFTANPTTGQIPLVVNFTNTSTGGTQYDWDFGDGNTSTLQDPSNTYINWGSFTATLVVTDAAGCTAMASTVITPTAESLLIVPNVFSPNNDGDNDLFFVTSSNLKSLNATITNRWGQFIYEFNTVAGSWDGTSSAGVQSPEGTYYYIIHAVGADDTQYEFTGSVTLIR